MNDFFNNINFILNTDEISYNNKMILIFLFILHWVIVIAASTYFIWGNPNLDKCVFLVIFFLFITWVVVYNDCIISYYEKQIVKNILNVDKIRNPSITLYNYTNFKSITIEIIVQILLIFNYSFIFIRYGIPKIFILIFIILANIGHLYIRYQEIIDRYNIDDTL
jgi:hypothetical protein